MVDDSGEAVLTQIQIGILSLVFTLSGIIFGLLSSFLNMKSFIKKEYPKIDLIINTFLSIGYMALICLFIIVAAKIQNYYVVIPTLFSIWSSWQSSGQDCQAIYRRHASPWSRTSSRTGKS